MRKHIFAAAILLVLPVAVAQAETPQEQFKAAYEKAETANKKAGELRNQWTTTANALKAAKAAADAGDFDKATNLAHEAEALANASIAQTEHEKKLWKDAVIR
jgi:hypothetical protein